MNLPPGAAEHCTAVRDRLVGALTLATGDRGVAEELAQEALVRTWQRWDQVAALDSPDAWTFRVGFNLAGSWRRRRAAELRANRRSNPRLTSSEGPSPEAIALRGAVAALPARQRSTVIARFYLGLDVATTAELLGCAPGTVKSATSQAIDALRRAGFGHLPDEDDQPPSSTDDERDSGAAPSPEPGGDLDTGLAGRATDTRTDEPDDAGTTRGVTS